MPNAAKKLPGVIRVSAGFRFFLVMNMDFAYNARNYSRPVALADLKPDRVH